MTAFGGRLTGAMKGLAVGAALGVALALPCTAAASGSGQQSSRQLGSQVNPGSPAGQEYVIPIPAARREAAGQPTSGTGSGAGGTGGPAGSGGSGAGSTNPPLFGIGVTPSSGGVVSGQAAHRGSSKARAGSHHHGVGNGSTVKPGAAPVDHPVSLAALTRPGSRDGNGWIALVGGGLLVLVVGGGAGLFVRRRLTGS